MHRLHTVAHVAPGSTIVEGVAIALPPEFPHGAVPPCVLSPDYLARFGLDRRPRRRSETYCPTERCTHTNYQHQSSPTAALAADSGRGRRTGPAHWFATRRESWARGAVRRVPPPPDSPSESYRRGGRGGG